jgi:hypothetical protein
MEQWNTLLSETLLVLTCNHLVISLAKMHRNRTKDGKMARIAPRDFACTTLSDDHFWQLHK